MKELNQKIRQCKACGLHETVTKKVIGRGMVNPEVLFIGEAPGAEEDISGKPFVGRSGILLDEWISFLGIESFAIINVVKCRPPENRDPTDEEIKACLPYAQEQIAKLKPKRIVLLGKTAIKTFLPELAGMGILENAGKFFDEYFVMPHPAYYIRGKGETWKGPLLNLKLKLQDADKKILKIFKLNYQKAENLGKFEMISPQLAACHHFCKLANLRFVDVDQKNICNINDETIELVTSEAKAGELQYRIASGIIEFINPGWEIEAKAEAEQTDIQPFAHLHLHTEYSIGDGYDKVKHTAKHLFKKGFRACAVTDHGTLAGTIYFQKALLEQGIKPILGTEAYVILKAEAKEYYHLVILAKNKKGWARLLRLQELAARENFYYRPRMLIQDVLANPEGLIVTSACQSGLIGKFILEEKFEEAEFWVKELKKSFGDDFYLELMPNRMPEQARVNKVLIKLANNLDIKTIITTDAHYANKSDEKFHKAVKAISFRTTYDKAGFADDTFYMLTAEEIKTLMKEHHDYISPELVEKSFKNTLEIVDKVDFKIEFKSADTLPQLYEHPSEELRKLTYEGLEEYTPYKIGDDEIKTRLELELGRFIEKKYANYFLIVHDYVQWCKSNSIMVGPGRGSVGGSLAAYALNITEVDPLRFDLLFDRFVSEIRKDAPDIDLDFEDEKRKQLHEYLKNKYGEAHYGKVITYSTWHAKGAMRDVGRIFQIPTAEINKISNLVVTRSGGDARVDFCLQDTFTEFEQAKEFYKKYKLACDVAIGLEGRIRHRGLHAAAIVLTKDPLASLVPIAKLNGEICTAWDKKEVESAYLVKFDILGLKTLSVINSTINLIEPKPKLPVAFDDAKVFDTVFKKGKCLGVFQFETSGLNKLSKQLKIDSFKLLYDANTLYRPGPLHSGETAEYVLRHNKSKEWSYDHKLLEPITKDTLGLILYQEQVMKVMFDLGKFSWATAESARKIMTKSQGRKEFNKMRDEFTRNAKLEHCLAPEESGKIFDVVSTFGSYGFNKSHAVGYSIISYWCAWLKTYYPREFFTTLLSKEDDSNQIANYVRDAKSFKLEIKTPDINLSKIGYYISDNKIAAGFDSVKGIGLRSAQKLIKHQPYTFNSFIKSKPSKTIWENLTKSGALDSFGYNRRTLMELREEIIKNKEVRAEQTEYDEKTKALMQIEVLDLPSEKPAIDYFDNPFADKIKFSKIGELEFMEFVDEVWIKGVITFINFKQEGLEGQWTMFDNVLERRYAHLNINDGTGNVLVHLAPEQYTYYKKHLEEGKGSPVLIKGHSIPNFNKIYCDGMIVLTDIDYKNPLIRFLQHGRKSALQQVKARYPKANVKIIKSVTYKVSKKKNPYARLNFYGDDKQGLVFKLTSDIFVVGQVIAYTCRTEPFLEVIGFW